MNDDLALEIECMQLLRAHRFQVDRYQRQVRHGAVTITRSKIAAGFVPAAPPASAGLVVCALLSQSNRWQRHDGSSRCTVTTRYTVDLDKR
jgi:hypothetical protein